MIQNMILKFMKVKFQMVKNIDLGLAIGLGMVLNVMKVIGKIVTNMDLEKDFKLIKVNIL